METVELSKACLMIKMLHKWLNIAGPRYYYVKSGCANRINRALNALNFTLFTDSEAKDPVC